jgi:large subunit ribosomal protein L18
MSSIKHINKIAKRTLRIRGKMHGTAERPRLTVSRSNHHIYAQLINDDTGATLLSLSDVVLTKGQKKVGTKTERATQVALALAEMIKKQKITRLSFDRGAYRYHGRVKAIAEGIRSAGIEV